MGDLSWNPTSWTPSNLAEEAVEFISGSEAAGDVAGLAAAWLTGDTMGLASQGMDLGQNIGAGIGTLLNGIGSAAQDAWSDFSNPGSVKPPNATQAPDTGYDAGEAASPNDTGTIGNQTGTTSTDTSDAGINSILEGPGSLEDKIFAILMLLQKEKKGAVEKRMNGLKGAGEGKDVELQHLQKEMGELSQLTQLTTNLMQSFKQMKDSVIQNLR